MLSPPHLYYELQPVTMDDAMLIVGVTGPSSSPLPHFTTGC